MGPSTILEMGGVACAITADDRRFIELLGQRYEGFISDHRPRFSIEVDVLSSAEHHQSPLEIEGSPVAIRLQGRTLDFTGRAFSAHFDLATGHGRIRQPLNLTPLDLIVKAIYAYYLSQEEAFFVHACALVRGGKGYLFFGPSGSGKSTLAGLAGQGVLADELVIVQSRPAHPEPHYRLYGTPFWGGTNTQARLAGSFALCIDEHRTARAPIKPMLALRKLLCCVGSFVPSEQHQARLFGLISRFAQDVPCEEFRFIPEPTCWRLLDAHA